MKEKEKHQTYSNARHATFDETFEKIIDGGIRVSCGEDVNRGEEMMPSLEEQHCSVSLARAGWTLNQTGRELVL